MLSLLKDGRQEKIHRLKYNDAFTVDLGEGLWAKPLSMDFDQDDDWDLVASCADVPCNKDDDIIYGNSISYLLFFKNIGVNTHPVFIEPANQIQPSVLESRRR